MANYEKFSFTNEHYLILCTISTYSKTASGKSWKSKPDEIERKVFKPINYTYYIQAIPFFNNFGGGASCRATYSNVMPGYLPTTVTSISPDRAIKNVATFKFIPLERLKLNAGWRENFIIENALYFDEWQQDGAKYLKLITTKTDDKHAGVINLNNNKWVN